MCVTTLDHLDNVRHNLAGTFYATTPGATSGALCGIAGTTPCEGYELLNSLDFADANSYSDGTINDDWRPDNDNPDTATNVGWLPIGDCNSNTDSSSGVCGDSDDTPFDTEIQGNGFSIQNLYVRSTGNKAIGIFGIAGGNSIIRNLRSQSSRIYGSASDAVGGDSRI